MTRDEIKQAIVTKSNEWLDSHWSVLHVAKTQERFYDIEWDDNLFSIEEIKQHKQSYHKKICGVYFLFKGDDLVYVGSSGSCFTRFEAHKQSGKKFDSYFIIDTSELERFEMLELENKYIFKYNPPLNKDSFMECRRRLGWIRTELREDE